MRRLLLISGLLILTGFGCQSAPSAPSPKTVLPVDSDRAMNDTLQFPGTLPAAEIHNKKVRLQTEKGEIVFELYDTTAPLAVSNFVYLAKRGYFDGLNFHRRVDEFVIQGGDPAGDGTGGPGYTFADELTDDYQYLRGTVAMANRGPNTNGSQFFIMLADNPLPKAYTIFGRVLQGIDVVDKIQIGDKIEKVIVE